MIFLLTLLTYKALKNATKLNVDAGD